MRVNLLLPRNMHSLLVRIVIACTAWFVLGVPTVVAQNLTVQAPARSLILSAVVPSFTLPLSAPLNPDTIWQSSFESTGLRAPGDAGEWTVAAKQRTAAKFTLTTTEHSIYTVEVPLVRMDSVQLFWRYPGGAWKTEQAGDTVALSDWPVIGQFPTFVLHFEPQQLQVELILVMQNAGDASVAVMLHSDRESRERRLIQANAAGLLIGASMMVLLINGLLFLLYRHKAAMYLLLYCACVTFGSALITGYASIWFTPNWPVFNDASKPFIASLICASMVCAGQAALDRPLLGRGWRLLGYWMAITMALIALLQLMVFPNAWRLATSALTAVLATGTLLVLSLRNWLLGDRYAYWVACASVLFALCAVVVGRGSLFIAGMDLFAAGMVLSLVGSSLMLRHVLVMRERFGLAVQGRAEVTRFLDPLTALLSYEGFERAVDALAVRQHGRMQLLYFSLTELDNFRYADGYVVWQRDLVRFAALLQKALGEGWQIARLSNSKFGAVRLGDKTQLSEIQALLTLVLSSCTRNIDTQGWTDRVGLRMAGADTVIAGDGLKDSLLNLEQAVRDLGANKRIAVL